MGELLARLNSLTRRQKDYMPDKLTMGSVTLDVRELELASGNTIRLSSREAELLRIMMMNKGKAVTTSDIFDRIWKDDEKKDDDIVWVYISYISLTIRPRTAASSTIRLTAAPYSRFCQQP